MTNSITSHILVQGGASIKKKRPGVDFFVKEISAGLTNLHNQEHI